MFGLDSTYLIKNYFDLPLPLPLLQGAQLVAQEVSTRSAEKNNLKVNLSSLNHTPISGVRN